MNYRRQVKAAALLLPPVRRLVGEKNRLSELSEKQAAQIDQLSRQKSDLNRLTKKLEQQNKTLKSQLASAKKPRDPLVWPLLKKQILSAKQAASSKDQTKKSPPFTINWVIPAVKLFSGGQQDILRTIEYLNRSGHRCRVYVLDPTGKSSLKEQVELLNQKSGGAITTAHYNATALADADATFATHWTTAYFVSGPKTGGKKYYYVQDYEPLLEPGSMSVFAENTYKLGLQAITLGPWLSRKLTEEYKMQCDFFDFGYEPKEYYPIEGKRKRDVFFYAQPGKSRRGFQLGLMALEIFHSANPDCAIHLFGEDLDDYDIAFAHIAHGAIPPEQINELYNLCSAGLVLSFTNMSLIPLEMLAAGCQPVVNDAAHTRMVRYHEMVRYSEPDPRALAVALESALNQNNRPDPSSIKDYSWDNSNKKIEKILLRDLA